MDTSHPQCWKMSPAASGPRVQLHTGQGNICFWRRGSRTGLFLPYSSFYIVLSFICFVWMPSDRTDLACSGGNEQFYETVWMNLYSVWPLAVLAHSHTETTSRAVTYLSGELNNHTHSDAASGFSLFSKFIALHVQILHSFLTTPVSTLPVAMVL